ncbi:MAG: M949_RS01915 family surface polysaccharide biosynthesis protein [Bacteroidota bacterium]
MKIHLTIIAALTLLFISGCGSSSDKQSREDLKEELKEELKQELIEKDEEDDTESGEVQENPESTAGKSENEVRMKDFTKQMVENAGLEYKEKIIFGKAWDDKNGENILVFTEGIETIAEHNDHGGDEERWNFYAYHYVDDGSGFELKREIKDFVTCYFLAGKFFKSSVNITDIDEDGKAEITFAYHVGCSPDGASLYPAKVMMLEDGEKYAIRGNTYLEQVEPPGGYETNIGENFQNAPEGFLDFAKEIWGKYRHRDVKDNL